MWYLFEDELRYTQTSTYILSSYIQGLQIYLFDTHIVVAG